MPYVSCPRHSLKTMQYKECVCVCVWGGGGYNIQQPRLPPNNTGRPMRQFKRPLAWLK